jgi:hypothetical protein
MWRRTVRIVLALGLLVALLAPSAPVPGLRHLLRASAAAGTALTLNPTSGPSGAAVTVSANPGTFAANSTMVYSFTDSGHRVTYLSGPQAASDGSLPRFLVQVPVGAATGVATFKATDKNDKAVSGTFAVTGQPHLDSVTPASGRAGEHVLVTGSGFTANGGVTFTIGGVTAAVVTGGSADAGGNVSALIAVPSLSGGASYNLVATDTRTDVASNALSFYVSPSGTITATNTPVTGAGDVTLVPTSGPPGTTITVIPNPATVAPPGITTVQVFYLNVCSSSLTPQPGSTGPVGTGGSLPTLSVTIAITETAPCSTVYVYIADTQGNLITTPAVFNLTGSSGGPTATQTATPTPAPAPLGPIVVRGVSLRAAVGAALSNVTVGFFADTSGLPAGSYDATIDWGDGSLSSAAAGGSLRAGVRPAGISEQYIITGSHTYAAAGTFPINVTIHATDGRTAYLTSIAEVGGDPAAMAYQFAPGWNLLSPQLAPGATLHASSVLSAILAASGGRVAAIYGLSDGRWAPSRVQQVGSPPSGADFALVRGHGYLIYTDAGAVISLGANGQSGPAAPDGRAAVATGLAPAQRAHLPPLPPLP